MQSAKILPLLMQFLLTYNTVREVKMKKIIYKINMYLYLISTYCYITNVLCTLYLEMKECYTSFRFNIHMFSKLNSCSFSS